MGIACGLEKSIVHPIADALNQEIESKNLYLPRVDNINLEVGRGIIFIYANYNTIDLRYL